MAGPIILKPDWRILYANWSIVDSLTHQPWEVPNDGILGIVFNDTEPMDSPYNVGRRIWSQVDFYWWNEYYDPPRWEGGDLTGMLRKTFHDYERKITGQREGALVSDEDWRKASKILHDDPDFRPKSAKLRIENV